MRQIADIDGKRPAAAFDDRAVAEIAAIGSAASVADMTTILSSGRTDC